MEWILKDKPVGRNLLKDLVALILFASMEFWPLKSPGVLCTLHPCSAGFRNTKRGDFFYEDDLLPRILQWLAEALSWSSVSAPWDVATRKADLKIKVLQGLWDGCCKLLLLPRCQGNHAEFPLLGICPGIITTSWKALKNPQTSFTGEWRRLKIKMPDKGGMLTIPSRERRGVSEGFTKLDVS